MFPLNFAPPMYSGDVTALIVIVLLHLITLCAQVHKWWTEWCIYVIMFLCLFVRGHKNFKRSIDQHTIKLYLLFMNQKWKILASKYLTIKSDLRRASYLFNFLESSFQLLLATFSQKDYSAVIEVRTKLIKSFYNSNYITLRWKSSVYNVSPPLASFVELKKWVSFKLQPHPLNTSRGY